MAETFFAVEKRDDGHLVATLQGKEWAVAWPPQFDYEMDRFHTVCEARFRMIPLPKPKPKPKRKWSTALGLHRPDSRGDA